eukprot:1962072-Amphidinium_carterae.1
MRVVALSVHMRVYQCLSHAGSRLTFVLMLPLLEVEAEDPAYLHSTGEIGLKSSNTTGAEQLEAWD